MKQMAGLLVLLSVLPACTPGKTITHSEALRLSPTAAVTWTRTDHSYPANTTYWPCGLDTGGLGGVPDEPASVTVGFDHFYDPGTNPFPCSKKLTHVYRGALQFDVGPVATHYPRVFVDQALLSFNRRPDPSQGRECSDSLLIATENWQAPGFSKLPPGTLFKPVPSPGSPSCGLGGCAMDVTSVVRNWVSGTEPRFGFVLAGEDESFPENNNHCWSRYGDLQLSVSFRWDETVP